MAWNNLAGSLIARGRRRSRCLCASAPCAASEPGGAQQRRAGAGQPRARRRARPPLPASVQLDPGYAEAYNNLGFALAGARTDRRRDRPVPQGPGDRPGARGHPFQPWRWRCRAGRRARRPRLTCARVELHRTSSTPATPGILLARAGGSTTHRAFRLALDAASRLRGRAQETRVALARKASSGGVPGRPFARRTAGRDERSAGPRQTPGADPRPARNVTSAAPSSSGQFDFQRTSRAPPSSARRCGDQRREDDRRRRIARSSDEETSPGRLRQPLADHGSCHHQVPGFWGFLLTGKEKQPHRSDRQRHARSTCPATVSRSPVQRVEPAASAVSTRSSSRRWSRTPLALDGGARPKKRPPENRTGRSSTGPRS